MCTASLSSLPYRQTARHGALPALEMLTKSSAYGDLSYPPWGCRQKRCVASLLLAAEEVNLELTDRKMQRRMATS